MYVFILLYAAPSAEWWSIDRECWWCVRAWCHWFKNPLYIAVHGILVGICYAAIKCFLNSKRSCSTHTTHVQIKYKCTNVDDARTRIWRCKMLVYIYATELSIHDLNARYTQNAKWISIYLFFIFVAGCRLLSGWITNDMQNGNAQRLVCVCTNTKLMMQEDRRCWFDYPETSACNTFGYAT